MSKYRVKKAVISNSQRRIYCSAGALVNLLDKMANVALVEDLKGERFPTLFDNLEEYVEEKTEPVDQKPPEIIPAPAIPKLMDPVARPPDLTPIKRDPPVPAKKIKPGQQSLF